MKIAVLGAGAMGSIIGGALAKAGKDVVLIDVAQETIEAINSRGLIVREKDGHEETIKVSATDRPGTVGRVDLIIVSHAAVDHLGDTEAIARRTGAPVICGGEVKAYLTAKGIPANQIRATTWGIAVEVAGIKVQPLECHHWSQIQMPDGTYTSGVPMAFIVYADPGVRFYHYGDTAIFSDLKLQAELYQPTIGCFGIANPLEILHRFPMPGRMLTAEMNPREGALAAQWLQLKTVLPCHFIDPDCPEVSEFQDYLATAKRGGARVPESIVMKPGETIEAP